MVFQKPNPFPKSIYENIVVRAADRRLQGQNDDLVEESLIKAALWDEVKDKLKESGWPSPVANNSVSALPAPSPPAPMSVLMDEPCSALDPIATLKIEELMLDLKKDYTIVIVTHNMQQAARVSDQTAFFSVNVDEEGQRTGYLVEFSQTEQIFTAPAQKQTEDYITGRFG